MAFLFSNTRNRVPHYYGDTVRKLFFASGFLMLVTYPFFQERLFVSAYVSIGTILILDIVAGFISPRMKLLSIFESIIALVGCIVFEYTALREFNVADLFFWTNQLLAILFFIALYYAVKTARSAVLNQQMETATYRQS